MTGISAFPERLPLFRGYRRVADFSNSFRHRGCVLVLFGKAQLVCHFNIKRDATVRIVCCLTIQYFSDFLDLSRISGFLQFGELSRAAAIPNAAKSLR